MRKLREGVDFNSVAEKISSIIKGYGFSVVLFKQDGAETSDPADARRFFSKDPNFMVTLDPDNDAIKVNKNSNVKLDEIEDLMKRLRQVANTYMLKLDIQVFGKEIAPKDFAYQAKRYREGNMDELSEAMGAETKAIDAAWDKILDKVDNLMPRFSAADSNEWDRIETNYEQAAMRDDDVNARKWLHLAQKFFRKFGVTVNEASMSRMYGHTKTSYQTLESVKLTVRHRSAVDENVRGSRSRQIKSIFIESDGERFRFPYNDLTGARAMARHLHEGGQKDDAVGQHILETIGNIKKLKEFLRYSRTNHLINEDSEDIVKTVRENVRAYRNELSKLSGAKTYHAVSESIHEQAEDNSLPGQDTSDLKDMFTVHKFDENIADALPLIKRLVTEKNAWRGRLKEASEQPFLITSSESLIESDAFEFESPVQQLGYKIRSISERAVEESELASFVGRVAEKLIEGKEVSDFEKSVIGNVLENLQVSEKEESYHNDAVEEVMESIERKLKLLEHGIQWDNLEEAPKPKKRRPLTVAEKHQLRIARDTLKMSDAGAMVMGGPSKEEAREIIRRLTGKEPNQ